MLSHLFRSATLALGAAIIFGTFVIFVTGGLDSPNVTPLVGVSIAAFFIFCITFACFVRRSHALDRLRDELRHGDGGTFPSSVNKWIRGDRRTDDGFGGHGEGGEGGGGDGGAGSD
ncbi:MAG TPA: hypothetical protein VG742_18185 [Dongiaceae bacterium]|nr:hypothetical protein [Dongiaceae bacterium]